MAKIGIIGGSGLDNPDPDATLQLLLREQIRKRMHS